MYSERLRVPALLKSDIDRRRESRNEVGAAIFTAPFVLSAAIVSWIVIVDPLSDSILLRSHTQIIILPVAFGGSSKLFTDQCVGSAHPISQLFNIVVVCDERLLS